MFKLNDEGLFLKLGGNEFEIVPHVISIIVITLVLVILAGVVKTKIKKADPLEKPKGIVLLTEMFVTGINNFLKGIVGDKMKGLAPYIGFLAVYLLIANTIGLLGLVPPTSNLTVTGTLGIITFLIIQYNGVRFHGLKKRIKSWAEPFIFMFPINVIGELALPVSLSFRLFGNILGGAIIMTILYGAIGAGFTSLIGLTGLNIGQFGELFASPFTTVFHLYFDLFAGLIQTFIFVLLTTIFISLAVE